MRAQRGPAARATPMPTSTTCQNHVTGRKFKGSLETGHMDQCRQHRRRPHRSVPPKDTTRIKVGGVYDPIWNEPAPLPVRSQRRPRRVVLLLLATAITLVAGLVAWFVWPSGLSGGDPGGHILNQLRTISRAVPPNATVQYAHYNEPHVDSCDGMAGTFGWDDASAQIEFTWPGSPSALIRYVGAALMQFGWGTYKPEAEDGVPGAAWTRRLSNGTTASAQLGFDPYGAWHLVALGAPVGKRVSGC